MDQETADVYSEVLELVARFSGGDKQRLTLDSRINFDLHIDGDDAEELLAELQRRYKIDWTGLNFSRYFDSEPHLFNIIPRLRRRFSKTPKQHEPLTIGDLTEAAIRKRWGKQ